MKPVKAWAIVQDGELCREYTTSQYDVYSAADTARNTLLQTKLVSGSQPRIVRVEIRAITPKKRGAK